MNILVVNDDGFEKEGLKILVKAASHFGSVYVAAPKVGQSAKSAAITIRGPIQIDEEEPILLSVRTVSVDGTPADCVRAALKVFETDFDLVLSGINHGSNLALDVQYSGTVAAAFEASLYQIPAIAFSVPVVTVPYLYDETVKLLDEMIENELYKGTHVLNVNFPAPHFQKVLGTRITKLGKRMQHLEYVLSDKANQYHLSHSIMKVIEDEDSDMYAYERGYVSITPLRFDRTDYQKINRILRTKA